VTLIYALLTLIRAILTLMMMEGESEGHAHDGDDSAGPVIVLAPSRSFPMFPTNTHADVSNRELT